MHLEDTKKQSVKEEISIKLPIIVWIVFIGSIIGFTEGSLFGYRMTGMGWFIPLCASLFILLGRIQKVKFPVLLWLPWIMLIAGNYFDSGFPALQRSVQILCPIVVGMAVSTYSYQPEHIRKFTKFLKVLSIILIVIILFRLRVPFTGMFPPVTGLSGQAMSAALFATFFATSYSFGRKTDLRWWWLVASVPVMAVTRTAIVITGLTLPFTWGPMKLRMRFIVVIIIIILGIALFYSPRLQKKSFRSGEGEMSDILSKDFSDNARYYMWKKFDEQIKKKLWFGYGAGAGETFVRQITNDQSGYPHNDWRLTLYDYGIFGAGIYVLCILLAIGDAYKRSKLSSDESRLVFLAGASAFIPFMLFMYTDNIMVYDSFFGNLQFTILGIAYGSYSQAKTSARIKLRFRW